MVSGMCNPESLLNSNVSIVKESETEERRILWILYGCLKNMGASHTFSTPGKL